MEEYAERKVPEKGSVKMAKLLQEVATLTEELRQVSLHATYLWLHAVYWCYLVCFVQTGWCGTCFCGYKHRTIKVTELLKLPFLIAATDTIHPNLADSAIVSCSGNFCVVRGPCPPTSSGQGHCRLDAHQPAGDAAGSSEQTSYTPE